MDDEAQEREEPVQHEHGALDEQDKRAKNGDDDIEFGHAVLARQSAAKEL